MNKLGARSLMVASLFGLAGMLPNAGCSSSSGNNDGGDGAAARDGSNDVSTSDAGGQAGHDAAATDSGTPPDAADGSAGQDGGGAAGTGGVGGGAAGTGGHAGTGGVAGGTAGAAGGTAGAAGGTAGAAGGTAGAAGGTAGATDGGAGAPPTSGGLLYTFDSTAQGWTMERYGGGNIFLVAGSNAAVAFDNAAGSPTMGSLKLSGTFSDYDQFLTAKVDISPWVDVSGKTMHAMVRLDGAISGGATFGATLDVTSSAGNANGPVVPLVAGTWTDVTFNLANAAAPFDATKLTGVAVTIHSSPMPSGGPAFPGPVSPTFHVDTVSDGSTTPPAAFSSTFDKNTQGYGLTTSQGSAQGDPVNLGGPSRPTGVAAPALTFDGAVGTPAAGSLKLTATFSDYNQVADVFSLVAPAANVSGKSLHAKVRLDSGTFPGPVNVTVHAQTGAGYVFAASDPVTLTPSTTDWTDVALDLTAAHGADATFDPTQLVQVGVQLSSGARPASGTFGSQVAAVLHIDSVAAQ